MRCAPILAVRDALLLGERDHIMSHLYELIQKNVDTWRGAGYPCADYPAIAEILEYVGRFTTAHGPEALHFYDTKIERSFLCWLAAIGVELLMDL